MTSKKQLLFAYGLAILLLLVGIVCFAAFAPSAPGEPIRIMYQTTAGKVLFDHFTHTDGAGYGLSCFDCHHHPSFDDSALIACVACHQTPTQPDVHPESCLDCHSEMEIEDTVMLSRPDAFHQQCIECHEQIGKGPKGGGDNCSACHVM